MVKFVGVRRCKLRYGMAVKVCSGGLVTLRLGKAWKARFCKAVLVVLGMSGLCGSGSVWAWQSWQGEVS